MIGDKGIIATIAKRAFLFHNFNYMETLHMVLNIEIDTEKG
ncbi:MAG: hypothetical protein ACE14S_02270 [Candidatus Bathyarchaeia archaeon]